MVKPVEVGDVVIVCDELVKRAFWRLGIVTELLTGMANVTRSTIVKTVNSERTQFLRRSIKHLVPVELKTNIEPSEDSSATTTEIARQDFPSGSNPSRR